jgi:hypothetical protein
MIIDKTKRGEPEEGVMSRRCRTRIAGGCRLPAWFLGAVAAPRALARSAAACWPAAAKLLRATALRAHALPPATLHSSAAALATTERQPPARQGFGQWRIGGTMNSGGLGER